MPCTTELTLLFVFHCSSFPFSEWPTQWLVHLKWYWWLFFFYLEVKWFYHKGLKMRLKQVTSSRMPVYCQNLSLCLYFHNCIIKSAVAKGPNKHSEMLHHFESFWKSEFYLLYAKLDRSHQPQHQWILRTQKLFILMENSGLFQLFLMTHVSLQSAYNTRSYQIFQRLYNTVKRRDARLYTLQLLCFTSSFFYSVNGLK